MKEYINFLLWKYNSTTNEDKYKQNSSQMQFSWNYIRKLFLFQKWSDIIYLQRCQFLLSLGKQLSETCFNGERGSCTSFKSISSNSYVKSFPANYVARMGSLNAFPQSVQFFMTRLAAAQF